MESKHYKSKEVLKLMGISSRTLTRKVASGEFKAIRKKGKLLFPKDQFKDLADKQEDNKNIMYEAIQELKEAQKDNSSLKVLEKGYEALGKQLEAKDKQITELQAQIKEKDMYHHQQLIQQQALTRQLQDKFLLLDQPEGEKKKTKPRKKPRKKTPAKTPEREKPEEKPEKKKKKGFFRWLVE